MLDYMCLVSLKNQTNLLHLTLMNMGSYIMKPKSEDYNGISFMSCKDSKTFSKSLSNLIAKAASL